MLVSGGDDGTIIRWKLTDKPPVPEPLKAKDGERRTLTASLPSHSILMGQRSPPEAGIKRFGFGTPRLENLTASLSPAIRTAITAWPLSHQASSFPARTPARLSFGKLTSRNPSFRFR